jgi:hypothetical protein
MIHAVVLLYLLLLHLRNRTGEVNVLWLQMQFNKNNCAPNHGFDLRSVPSELCSSNNDGLEVSHPWMRR